MKPEEFLGRLDDARVTSAIEAAERLTSAEICVFVSSRRLGGDDVVKRAEARFRKLGMEATRERNGVLLYFVPLEQKYAVIGDRGIHEKCGPEFWQEIAAGLHEKLARDEFTDAVVEAVNRVGAAMAAHFPRSEDDRDELPNAVFRDGPPRLTTAQKISLGILALFFVVAGVNHFRMPETYLGIMPDWLPWPLALVWISGVAEIAGAIGVLIPAWRRAAAWGLIALLVAVFPANIHAALQGMIINGEAIPEWILWVRLPGQFLFIAWVWWTCLRSYALERTHGTVSRGAIGERRV